MNRGADWVEQTLNDLRYALRSFRNNKAFAGVALLTLALGIGANTAIFSIIDVVLLHPLAYPDSDRLVALSASNFGSGVTIVSFRKLEYLQGSTQTLEQVAAYYALNLNLTFRGEPVVANGVHASRELLLMLGAAPLRGRTFLPEEDRPGGRDVALISDSFWRNHLSGDPEIVGKSITIDGHNTTVIGVLPECFRFPFLTPEPDVWLPRILEHPAYSIERIQAGAAYLVLVGKIRRGRTLEGVRAEVDTICSNFRQSFPNLPDAAAGISVDRLEEFLSANVRGALLAVAGAVGFVLLIACVNVANLLMARATSRAKEMGVRRALGAGLGRLARQFLAETLLLSFLGGALGVAIAALSLPLLLRTLTPGAIPLSDLVHLDVRALLFAFLLCCFTGVLFGAAPAWQAARTDLSEKLKQSARGSTGGGGWMRKVLVVSEVSLTLLLMSGAGLLIESMVALTNVNPGFVAQDLTAFPFSLPAARYANASDRVELYRRLIEEVRVLPGIQSASLVSHVPFNGAFRFMHICPEGAVCAGLGNDPIVMWLQVSPDYFQTMRLKLIDGRPFDERDRAGSPPVVIIGTTIADRYFAGTNPIGRHIVVSRDKLAMEIVGVAADIKFTALNAPNAETILVPYTQNPWPSMNLLVRSSARAPVSEVRRIVSRLDTELPVSNVQGMDTLVSGSLAQPRLLAGLVGAFALAGLSLAAIGIYGVMAYLVSQRSPEIAIRVALGAQRWMVFRLVVGEGLKLVAVGIGAGLLLSVALGRLIATLLFGTRPNDGITFIAVSGVLMLVAFGACYFPARRAMDLDPVQSLRNT